MPRAKRRLMSVYRRKTRTATNNGVRDLRCRVFSANTDVLWDGSLANGVLTLPGFHVTVNHGTHYYYTPGSDSTVGFSRTINPNSIHVSSCFPFHGRLVRWQHRKYRKVKRNTTAAILGLAVRKSTIVNFRTTVMKLTVSLETVQNKISNIEYVRRCTR